MSETLVLVCLLGTLVGLTLGMLTQFIKSQIKFKQDDILESLNAEPWEVKRYKVLQVGKNNYRLISVDFENRERFNAFEVTMSISFVNSNFKRVS